MGFTSEGTGDGSTSEHTVNWKSKDSQVNAGNKDLLKTDSVDTRSI